jgi:DNA-binding response OmpR family regulator
MEHTSEMPQRVLIVDDDPANVALLKAMLEDVVEEVRGITDSAKAEQAFKEFEPDLLLLDLHMPPPDGLTLLRRLSKARDNLGYLPVIVLTADDDKAARSAALELEADDFLLKPLDRQEVRLRVRNLLHTRHLFKEVTRTTGAFPVVRK